MHIFTAVAKIINGVTYYQASEVADRAGIHRLTLIRWIREGKLADAPRDRNGWRIFSDELTLLLKQRWLVLIIPLIMFTLIIAKMPSMLH